MSQAFAMSQKRISVYPSTGLSDNTVNTIAKCLNTDSVGN